MRVQKNEDGQALVEFALVLVVLLLIIFGIIEFGRIFHAHLVVTHAAREGARVGVVTSAGTREDAIKNTVIDRGITLGLSETNISTEPVNPGDAAFSESLTVSVNYDVDIIIPLISSILPDPFPVAGSAVMRVE